jgi:hypothetical protein
MRWRTSRQLRMIAPCAFFLTVSIGCGSSTPVAPTPVLQTENFTGTLQPLGVDFKTFTIAYTQNATDLSVTINTLTTVAGGTPVTGITIGVGFGVVSGGSCSLQVQSPTAPLGQELFVPNGGSAGAYCVEIFDCPTGATGCTSTLTEPVNYTMAVKHY